MAVGARKDFAVKTWGARSCSESAKNESEKCMALGLNRLLMAVTVSCYV